MPKEKNVGVSKETLKLLKDFKKEVAARSLEEAITLAVGYARTYKVPVIDLFELESKINRVSGWAKSNASYLVNLGERVRALEVSQNKKDVK